MAICTVIKTFSPFLGQFTDKLFLIVLKLLWFSFGFRYLFENFLQIFVTAALEIAAYRSWRHLQENSETASFVLMLLAIIIMILTFTFWTFYFFYLSCKFYKIKSSNLYYSFKDGLINKRCTVIRYYVYYLFMRLVISLMIGFTSFLSKDQNETLWICIIFLNFFNCFPLMVFKSFVENFNHMASNLLLLWISIVFTLF